MFRAERFEQVSEGIIIYDSNGTVIEVIEPNQ